jgi:mycothione reductase
MENFDLIVIGSGSGNAIPEYWAGRKIALIERGTFGGTCLNVGCIPSKMFVLPADLVVATQRAERLGVSASVSDVDWAAIRDRVFGRIDPITEGGEQYRAEGTPNLELIRGTARFVGPRQIDVDGRRLSAERILVAVGARSWLPDLPGLSEVRTHTSDTIMRLERFPARLGIIGGGYIATELGHVFSGYGSDVTLFNRSPQLLRGEDHEISQRFTEVFAERVTFRGGVLPDRVEQVGDAIRLYVGDEVVEVDELLVAVGRVPNADLVDAAAGGLDVRADGTIAVDDTMATSVEGVAAIGDVANSYQLKHLANQEAATAFWNLAHPDGPPRRVDYRAVPHAVFSNPQVAAVGLTEAEATAAGHDFVVGRRDYGGTAYGWALEDTTSFAKVLIERSTGLLLGAHVLGPQAASLIQPLIQAIQFGETADRVAREVFYIHPALTEVVENAVLDGLAQLAPA